MSWRLPRHVVGEGLQGLDRPGISTARMLQWDAGMSHANSIEASGPVDAPGGRHGESSPLADGWLFHLSPAQFVGSLAASVALFLFATGPVWRHAGDIGKLDAAIWWSYGAIPLLVAGCLIISRRWSLRGFLLDTMALTLVKYVVTCTIAIACWSTVAPPRAASAMTSPRRAPAPAPVEPAVVPTRIDPARTGTLRATVVDRAGQPLAGALVFVASGLEDHVFAVPAGAVAIAHGPRGITPALAVAQVGQRVEARSTDGRMHTLVARRGSEAVFNVPLLASGDPTTTRLRDAQGWTELLCNVHPEEPRGRLLVLAHPFSGWSDAAGQVVLSGVPAGALRVGAAQGDRGMGDAGVELRPMETVEVRIEVAP